MVDGTVWDEEGIKYGTFCNERNIPAEARVRDDMLHEVRPPGRGAAERKEIFPMKMRTMFLAVVALVVLGGLTVPANAIGRHHHRHHHHHKR